MMATKKKTFNANLDELLSGIDLPSDEEIKSETKSKKLAEVAKSTHKKRGEKWKNNLSNANSQKKDNVDFKKKCEVSAREKVSKKSWIENNKKSREKLYSDKEIIEKRNKSIREANDKPEVRERKRKATQKAQGVIVEVMEPNGLIRSFPSAGEASRYYKWPTLSTLPKESFPLDGSWKEWVGQNKRNAKRDGYKTRRKL
jgi:hypothetical protein